MKQIKPIKPYSFKGIIKNIFIKRLENRNYAVFIDQEIDGIIMTGMFVLYPDGSKCYSYNFRNKINVDMTYPDEFYMHPAPMITVYKNRILSIKTNGEFSVTTFTNEKQNIKIFLPERKFYRYQNFVFGNSSGNKLFIINLDSGQHSSIRGIKIINHYNSTSENYLIFSGKGNYRLLFNLSNPRASRIIRCDYLVINGNIAIAANRRSFYVIAI